MQILPAETQCGTKLTVFSAYSNAAGLGCHWDFPGLIVVEVNATKLLLEYGFAEVLPEIRSWEENSNLRTKKHQYARISDILRVLLAHKYKYQYTYNDYDVYYLNKDIN
jgi:hypothetical protein